MLRAIRPCGNPMKTYCETCANVHEPGNHTRPQNALVVGDQIIALDALGNIPRSASAEYIRGKRDAVGECAAHGCMFCSERLKNKDGQL